MRTYDATNQVPDKPIVPKSRDWAKGFLIEMDRLFASDSFNVMLPAEIAMLDVVRKELNAIVATRHHRPTSLFSSWWYFS